jgi:hypothetical protein
MQRCNAFVATAAHVSLLAGALVLSASAASAAPDCLAAPDRTSSPGTHWYYRIDRPTGRKCWYLKQLDARAATPAAPPAAPRQDADAQPQLFSWLSSAFSSIRRPEPDRVTARESGPPAPDTTRKRERKQAQRPDAVRAPTRSSAPQPAVTASEAPPRSWAPTPAAASSEAPELAPAARGALYQQFLQWRVRQLLAPELPPDLQGGTLERSPVR